MSARIILEDGAVMPSRAHPTDVGYDLYCIQFLQDLAPNVRLYDTGVRIQVPDGYYCEVVPRSSMSKTGMSMANSVGIIDPDYTGTIKIALRFHEDAVAPVLPFRCCQLILRKRESLDFVVVETFAQTQRGEGGFGSTNN